MQVGAVIVHVYPGGNLSCYPENVTNPLFFSDADNFVCQNKPIAFLSYSNALLLAVLTTGRCV